ncbi:MAG: APC family permease [Oscillospiraceae bacterium]|nr:APC family permease [Oscillospiraceae bacterium]
MEERLEKRYGLFTAICMVVGIVIGSGIFFKTESVLTVTGGDAMTGVLGLIIVGVIMFICAYAFSIMAQKYEKVNGLVDYAEVAAGERYAYYLGWFSTFIYTPAITSVLGWLSARYTCVLFGFENPVTGPECMLLAGVYLVASYTINTLSPALAGKLQVTGTVVKLIPLLLMAVVGTIVGLGNGQLASNFAAASTSAAGGASGGLMTAIVALAFAYEGWILTTTINAELKDSKKNLPIALMLGSVIVVAVYVFYYLGICGAISIEELMATSSQQAFINTFGNVFGTLLTVFIIISCACTMHGLMLASVRNMYSIAARGHGPMPEVFSRIDPATNMPNNSCVMGLLLSLIFLAYFYGANLAPTPWFGWFCFDSSELPIVTLYAFYIPVFASMMKDKSEGVFKRYIVPVAAIACCFLIIYAAFVAHGKAIPAYLIIFAVVMLAAVPFYKKKAA